MKLLLIACSEKKTDKEQRCKAIDLYDGPSYRTIRKMIREDTFPKNVDVYIISGKYGLISAHDIIDTYDQRISEKTISETNSRDKLRMLVKSYDEVYVNLGRDYLSHFSDILDGCTFAKGRIGQKNSQMKQWLLYHHKIGT